MGTLGRWLAHAVFPLLCAACRRELRPDDHRRLCDDCWATLVFRRAPVLPAPPSVDGLFAACAYRGAIRDCLHGLKYEGRDHLAGPLGRILIDCVRGWDPLLEAEIVLPVPLHWWRAWRRDYNQAELLARPVAAHYRWRLEPRAMVRTRSTPTQTGLDRIARRKNLQDAFRVVRLDGVRGRTVVLLDDVITTGATLGAAAVALRSAGAARVYGLAVAHADLDDPRHPA